MGETVMFARKALALHTKADQNRRGHLMPRTVLPSVRSAGEDRVEEVPTLQPGMRNQVTGMHKPGSNLKDSLSQGSNEQDARPNSSRLPPASRGIAWDFRGIPIFPAEPPQFQTAVASSFTPSPSGVRVFSGAPVFRKLMIGASND